MIPIEQHDGLHILAGTDTLNERALAPYSEPVCDFLSALSRDLQSDEQAARMADVMTFAFWIRPANLRRLRESFDEPYTRIGLGLLLHIAPSNVPVNFAFSLVFGLLSGNANLVRVPSKESPQVTAIYAAMNRLFSTGRWEAVRQRICIVRYPRNDLITRRLSALCDGRVIWGGDETIRSFRQFDVSPRTIDLSFADRYSICVLDGVAIARLDEMALGRLAIGFYNDTYLVDQNACSSPHLVIWTHASATAGEERFWSAVQRVAMQRYALEPIKQIDKYAQLMHDAVALHGNAALSARHAEYVYRIRLRELADDTDRLRGRFGYFYEYHDPQLTSLNRIVTRRYQTLTYFGVDPGVLKNLVVERGMAGIDRIVPVGRALDIDVVWDGCDVIRTLSRIVDQR